MIPLDESDCPNLFPNGDNDHLLVKPSALKPFEPGSSFRGPHNKLEPCGALMDVIPTDGSNIDATTQLPYQVKRYLERWLRDDRRHDFTPDSTVVLEHPYVDFRVMHNKRADVKLTTTLIQM